MRIAGTGGQISWSGSRDSMGFREFKVKYRVDTENTLLGPAAVLQCPGLPTPGSIWNIDSDIDIYAWCRWDCSVQQDQPKEGDPSTFWTIEFTFSTKPPETGNCHSQSPTDPLLEPQKISGSCIKYVEEATLDRHGVQIVNSAHEQIRGPQVEFDNNRPQIVIEQNVAVLDLGLCQSMVDTLNDDYLWGAPPRCIKLSDFKWERKFNGLCYVYYTRTFTFDIWIKVDQISGQYTTGFDRDALDEGTKVLNGHWDKTTGAWTLDNIGGSAPSYQNPAHFVRYKDRNDENSKTILDGAGQPLSAKIMGVVENMDFHDTVSMTSTAHALSANDRIAIVGIRNNLGMRANLTSTDDFYGVSSVFTIAIVTDANNVVLQETLASLTDIANGYDTDNPGTWFKLNGTQPGKRHIEKYNESNFLLLGIPTVF